MIGINKVANKIPIKLFIALQQACMYKYLYTLYNVAINIELSITHKHENRYQYMICITCITFQCTFKS